MDDPEFLNHFWSLGAGDAQVRRSAIKALVSCLKAANERETGRQKSGEKKLP